MKSLKESILSSTGAGKNSDEMFSKEFKKAFNNVFGMFVYEKGLETWTDGNYGRAQYPLVIRNIKSGRNFVLHMFEDLIKDLVDELGDCREPYYAQEGITRKNRIDDEDEQVPIRTKIYITGDVPMFKKIDVLFIGVFKDPTTNEPAYLCIDATPDQIKKLFGK